MSNSLGFGMVLDGFVVALFPAASQLSTELTCCCVLDCFEATFASGGEILDAQNFGPQNAQQVEKAEQPCDTEWRHSLMQNHPG